MSEGEPGTAGRQLQWPRGKTLGGTSSINGMLYVRGNPADYDNWAQMGCRGWSYDEVLPFFKKSETYRGGGDPEYRSRGGPLIVEDYRTILPLTHGFVEAAKQAGFPFTPDYNGRQQEGVAYSQMTRRGRLRGSTARTFLAEARRRANLRIETDAIATRLLFEGKRCVGVAFRQNGADREVRAAREVIVSRRRRELAASACRSRASARQRICTRSACRWCTTCPGSAPTSTTIIVDPRLAPGAGRGVDQPVGRAACGWRARWRAGPRSATAR